MKRLVCFLLVIVTVATAFAEKKPKTTQEVALAISKWMASPKVSLPIAKRELTKLAAYRAAGFQTVVFCPGQLLDLVHLTRGPAKFRLGNIATEGGDIKNDVSLSVQNGKIVAVGPDCDCGDVHEDARLKPTKSKAKAFQRRTNATPKRVAYFFT